MAGSSISTSEREAEAVAAAFARIAEELLSSMLRNMAGHMADEALEGFDWVQWQALALSSLVEYSRENAILYGPMFDALNERIEAAIRAAWESGGSEAEAQLLEAVRSGWAPPMAPGDNPGAPFGGGFFHVPRHRLDALVRATHSDMMAAEHALLRRADDVYRQTVLAAQVYGTSGAGTLAKAVDMAVVDFAAKGIGCIEYADGSVHSIEEYSRMAVRTAVKRAQLAGDGAKRDEWGVHTVIVARNAQGCGKCMQWSGQVLVDDVYSGGTAAEAARGGWTLLSTAMAGGLFHPNCRDMTSTWFPGLSPEPDPPTRREQEAAGRREDAERRESHAAAMERRHARMERLALDDGNRERHAAKRAEWRQRAQDAKQAEPKQPAKPLTKRQELERDARAVLPRQAEELGITLEEAERRFDLLVQSNTDAQLRRFIKRHQLEESPRGGIIGSMDEPLTDARIREIADKYVGGVAGEHYTSFQVAAQERYGFGNPWTHPRDWELDLRSTPEATAKDANALASHIQGQPLVDADLVRTNWRAGRELPASGDRIDWGLTSASSNPDFIGQVARDEVPGLAPIADTAVPHYARDDELVAFHFNRSHAIDISDIGAAHGFERQSEWIVSGSYEVVGVSKEVVDTGIVDRSRPVDLTPRQYAEANGLEVEYFTSKKGKPMARFGTRTYPVDQMDRPSAAFNAGYGTYKVTVRHVHLRPL